MGVALLLHWLACLLAGAGALLCLWYLWQDEQVGRPTHRPTQAALALFLAVMACFCCPG